MKLNFCNIATTKEIKEANCITHSGTFHADEVFATVLLSIILKDIKVLRINELKENVENAIIYDVGLGKLDHHQKGGNGKRDNGVMYAACGLVWKEYGRKILEKIGVDKKDLDYMFNQIDKKLIQYIDANDNGITPSIDIDADIRFIDAVNLAKTIVENILNGEISKLKAKDRVEKAIENSENGILVLDEFMPWKEFVLESKIEKAKDILFAVFPSNRGGYSVYTVPKEEGSFENRKNLPKEWAGLRDEALQKVTGVKTARFCHTACFICMAETKEDAIKHANNI